MICNSNNKHYISSLPGQVVRMYIYKTLSSVDQTAAVQTAAAAAFIR